MPQANQKICKKRIVIRTYKIGKHENLMFGLEITSLTEHSDVGSEAIYYTEK